MIELIGVLRLLKCLTHAIDVGRILTEPPTHLIVAPWFSARIRSIQVGLLITKTPTKDGRFA